MEDRPLLRAVLFAASLSGIETDHARTETGKQIFAENCASCHGDGGTGNKDMGAPDLTDAITLYVSTEADIAEQIKAPKHGVMPAWRSRLGDVNIKELATYVHSLGGGE